MNHVQKITVPLFTLICALISTITFAQIQEPNQALSFNNPILALNHISEKPRAKSELLGQFYKQYPKPYAWIENGTLSANAITLKDIILKAREDALNPAHYHAAKIDALIKDFATLDQASQQALDVLLTDAFLAYALDMGTGRAELRRTDREWLLKGRTIDPLKLLINALTNDTLGATLHDLVPKYNAYAGLKAALPHYQKLAKNSATAIRINAGKTLELNNKSERVVQVRARLIAHNLLDQTQATSDIYDTNLRDAIKLYQQQEGLDIDGKVGPSTLRSLNSSVKDQLAKIEINMERWRWMPQSLGDFYLTVDITGFEYFIIKDGIETIRAKIVVGTASRPTPVFTADMNHIVFSPYWGVPNSIAVKDKLPLLRKDPYRLARSGIRLYDRKGNEIDPGMVDWETYNQNNFKYTMRQDPGANNALGRVKFMFPNSHAIYLHDTPTKSLFDKKVRTYSSGCIRIQNPLELAEYLLKDKGWSPERIKAAYNKGKESSVKLDDAMRFPVYILYMTAWADAKGDVDFRPDIYNRDADMYKALANLNK
ncbi:peptidoglycan-binding protein [Gammaproteobacteria bacterium]|nr:peptidoglycan-binding protein [Gammaproteobacteria bacterium]